MSFGREPHYIYECVCDGENEGHPKGRHVAFAAGAFGVRWDELAQFVATVHWRGELYRLIDRGRQLRPELADRAQCARCGDFGHLKSPPGEPAGDNCRAAGRFRD